MGTLYGGNRRAHEGAAGRKHPASLSPVGFRPSDLSSGNHPISVKLVRRAEPMENRRFGVLARGERGVPLMLRPEDLCLND